ncbi:MAG: hypothetical protein LBR80_10495 [Deltaproteobacteria bacterium]|nr:hypothetical protein [Deltaproteobacteria bacterium]
MASDLADVAPETDLRPVVNMLFNQPVELASLVGNGFFIGGDPDAPFRIPAVWSERYVRFAEYGGRSFRAAATGEIPRGQRWTLIIEKGVVPGEGLLPLEEDLEVESGTAHGDLVVIPPRDGASDGDGEGASGMLTLQDDHGWGYSAEFSLSNPVRMSDAAPFVEIAPPARESFWVDRKSFHNSVQAPPGCQPGESESEGEREGGGEDGTEGGSCGKLVQGVRFRLAADTDYVVTVKRGLPDIFGQTLFEDQVTRIRTGPFRPFARLGARTGTIESAMPATVPLLVRNMTEAQVYGAVLTDAETAWLLRVWDIESCLNDRMSRGCDTEPVRFLRIPNDRISSVSAGPAAECSSGETLVPVPLSVLAGGREKEGAVFVWTGGHDSYAFFQVTDLALTVKVGATDSLAWVTRLSDASNVPGASVSALDCRGKVLWSGQTGADGLARLPGGIELAGRFAPGCEPKRYMLPDLHFTAARDGERVFWSRGWNSGFDSHSLGISGMESPFDLGGRIVTAFADSRPVYAADDTAKLKIIARHRWSDGLSTPEVGDARVIVRRRSPPGSSPELSGWEVAFDGVVSMGSYGTVPVESPLTLNGASDGTMGDWGVFLVIPTEMKRDAATLMPTYNLADSVKVGEIPVRFRGTPAFRLTLGETPDLVAGESAVFTVAAVSADGSPLDGGEADFELDCGPGEGWRRPPGFGSSWSFSSREERFKADVAFRVSEGAVGLAHDGTATFEAEIPEGASLLARPCTVSVTVADRLGRTVSRNSAFTLHPSSLHLGLKDPDSSDEPMKPNEMELVVASMDGTLVPGVKVRVVSYGCSRHDAWKLDPAGHFIFEYGQEGPPVSEQEVTSGEGPVAFEEMPDDAGCRCVKGELTDPEGRKVLASNGCLSPSEFGHFIRPPGPDSVEIKAERDEYVPGDVARIVVRSPFEEGTALVTVERDGIRQAGTFDLGVGPPVMEIHVGESDAPEVYVSAVLARGRTAAPPADGERGTYRERDGDAEDPGRPTFRTGYLSLRVRSDRSPLNLEVTPSEAEVRPGDRVAVKVRVTTRDGTPFSDCEVSLAAEDEGNFHPLEYRSGMDPLSLTRWKHPLKVRTSSSLAAVPRRAERPSYSFETPPDGHFFAPDPDLEILYFRPLSELRRDIGPGVFFAPRLMPDENGEVETQIALPGPGTYRLTATAVGRDRAIGTGEARVAVRLHQDKRNR